jgi:large subunit ribosomal protein L3
MFVLCEEKMANKTIGLVGRKVGMTQIFKEDGESVAVTVLEAGPCTVLQIKTEDGNDGYNAIQVGFGSKKESRITKAEKGHLAKTNTGAVAAVKEFRLEQAEVSKYEAGQVLSVSDVFTSGTRVDIGGVSKGRGLAGVMKKYNFKGSIRSHGVHEFFRHGGSIGTRLTPGHVIKGKKMPGHMGAEKVTVQNLKIESIDTDRNLIMVRGGVPGANGSLVSIRQAVKRKR